MTQPQATFNDWMATGAIAIGHALMAKLPGHVQVARAKAVLDLCRSRLGPVPEIEHVAALAADSERWAEAHKAFTAVRKLRLPEGRKPMNEAYNALLLVAEITAKIIYNASGAPAPFDSDSPWWLPPNARDFVRAVADDAFAHEVWCALTGGATRAGPDG